MKCPHCLESFFSIPSSQPVGGDLSGYQFIATFENCPGCRNGIIFLRKHNSGGAKISETLIYPKAISRAPISTKVPKEFVDDYRESCLVLSDSAKASAALSRRCLQHLLREKAQTKSKDLYGQIDEVLQSKALPSQLAEALDAVRVIGNFAAHPIKSTNSGEIVDVELGEAEWSLDVIEGLFDYYFVQPSILQKKKDDLNKKTSRSWQTAFEIGDFSMRLDRVGRRL
jgi:Domain of unknown function (DUF4145)